MIAAFWAVCIRARGLTHARYDSKKTQALIGRILFSLHLLNHHWIQILTPGRQYLDRPVLFPIETMDVTIHVTH
jgi:hypothetical protein